MSENKGRENPDREQIYQFMHDLLTEVDRAAVIIGVAKIERALYHLLRRKLVPVPSGRDDLLDPEQAVGSFGSQIKLAYRIGLIDARLARALDLARKIRNDFAHESVDASLQDGRNRDRVHELAADYRGEPIFERIVSEIAGHAPGASGEFRAVVSSLAVTMITILEFVEPLRTSNAIPLPNEKGLHPGDKAPRTGGD